MSAAVRSPGSAAASEHSVDRAATAAPNGAAAFDADASPILIPTAVRSRLKLLRLTARVTPSGQGFGQHASRIRGTGLEFAQYRAYEPGDEPRHIDWKLYARADRYFVRDAVRDAPLAAWLVVDTSASMSQTDSVRPGWSRLAAAQQLAACIVDVALRHGDSSGFVTAGGTAVSGVPAAAGARHRDRLLLALGSLRAEDQAEAPDSAKLQAAKLPAAKLPTAKLQGLPERIPPAALVIVLSDGFDDALIGHCERLAAARRDVVLIQILTAEERDFPYQGGHEFVDPETGARRRAEAAALREDFLQRFAEARAALAKRLARSGIRHAEHWLDAPIDRPLQQLFGGRAERSAAR